METKTAYEDAAKLLESEPYVYIEMINSTLVNLRQLVWLIIQNKKFTGFDDAKKLVKAYEALDKAYDVFKNYQPPLPLKKEELIREVAKE